MSLLGKIFGSKNKEAPKNQPPPDEYTIASMIASTIEGIISVEGFSALQSNHAAVVLDTGNRVSFRCDANLPSDTNISGFAYLKELPELETLKSCFDLMNDLPADEAKEMGFAIIDSIGRPAVDKLAISALQVIRS